MIEQIEKRLNCNEELRKNISTFIEAFVKYYGEDRRKNIEEKLSKATYIGYQTINGIKSSIRNLEKIKSEELINELIENSTLKLTKEDLYDKYGTIDNKSSPIYELEEYIDLSIKSEEELYNEQIENGIEYIKNFIPNITREEFLEIGQNKNIPARLSQVPEILINNIINYCNRDNIRNKKERKYNQIHDLVQKIIPEITIENFNSYLNDEKMKELITLANKSLAKKEEYEQFKLKYSKYYEEIEKYDKESQNMKKELHKEFIKENLHLVDINNTKVISESDKKEFEDYLYKDSYSFYNKYLKSLFNSNLTFDLDIEAFSEEQEEILNSLENEWKSNTIKNNRINYFKSLGIDLGDDYEPYLNNEEVSKYWPKKEMVEQLRLSRKKYLNKLKTLDLNNIESYRKIREEINSKELIIKDDGYDAYSYERNGSYIAPNAIENGLTYDEHSLFVINFDYENKYQDHYIVHELNHVFELSLLEKNGNEIRYVSGWDDIICKIDEEMDENVLDDRNIRPYELFNEIINELIAQEISEIMHKEKLHVFNNEEEAKYQHATSYEHTFFLIKEFYDEFKNAILESRTNGNIDAIFNEVGKENFEDLNNLFAIYNEHFSGEFTIYKVLGDIKENKETNLTKLYFELMDKQHEIVEKMKMYKEMHKKEEYTL